MNVVGGYNGEITYHQFIFLYTTCCRAFGRFYKRCGRHKYKKLKAAANLAFKVADLNNKGSLSVDK